MTPQEAISALSSIETKVPTMAQMEAFLQAMGFTPYPARFPELRTWVNETANPPWNSSFTLPNNDRHPFWEEYCDIVCRDVALRHGIVRASAQSIMNLIASITVPNGPGCQ